MPYGRILELNLVLYDTKIRRILQTFVAFEIPPKSKYIHKYMAYFADYVNFEEGIIIAMAFLIKSLECFLDMRGQSLCFSDTFHLNFLIISAGVSVVRFFITSNRKNDILIFVLGNWNVGVYELFDILCSTCLSIRAEKGPFEVFSNEIGEEYNVYARKKIYVYLHKSMFKSLTLQSGSVVAKSYAN